MNMTPRYSLDDTIIDDPVKRVSMNIKGVTYFDRQTNLKSLYEQHLKKEDKHLTLEKFFVSNTQTLRLLFNGLDIGTIPEEHLHMFYSYHFNYELSNIHIDFFRNEYGKIIYWAKLFVIFTPKQRYSRAIIQVDSKKTPDDIDNSSTEISTVRFSVKPLLEEIDNTIIGDSTRICLFVVIAIILTFVAIFSQMNILFFVVGIFFLLSVFYIYDLVSALHNTNPSTRVKLTEHDLLLLNAYRNAEYSIKENVLLCLDLNYTPQKKKKSYKSLSVQEMRFLVSYEYASKAIQNKVNEILNL
jgi:hypothetical protein